MRKIIITQDIKALLDQEDNFLNRADLRIFPAVSNEEALDIHRAEKTDVIIADLDSQVLSGELFCAAIRDNEELCRVSLIIMHSGAASDIQRISRCRANAFIEKSTDPAVIIERARLLMSIPGREAFRAPISIIVNCEDTRQPVLGYAENISVTGMLFDSEKSFSKGETILCWFVLPDSTRVRAVAEIVRISSKVTEHDTNQYGVRFLGLDPACRAAIADYVRKRQRGK